MKRLTALALIALCLPAAAEEEASWIQLFNGKNLDGWTPKITHCKLGENFNNTFRVENGVIKVSFDKYTDFGGHYGHLFYKSPFQSYRFRAEYRFVGEQCPGGAAWATRNSGVMIHCQDPATMRENQEFPVSIEVQLLGGLGKGERPTGNLCTPGTHVVMDSKLRQEHCIESKSKTFDGDEWVTIEIDVRGTHVKHLVNGETVLEYDQPQLDERDQDAKALIELNQGEKLLKAGWISLQAESHPVEFRKVEILPIK
jgi:hypothetical protein